MSSAALSGIDRDTLFHFEPANTVDGNRKTISIRTVRMVRVVIAGARIFVMAALVR
jgi:hypothetical protein